MIHYTVDHNIAVVTWQMTTAPMNVLNDESVPALEAVLNRAYADETIIGLIMTSAKPEFVAGADLKMILRNADADPAEMMKISAELNRLARTLETWGKPTVAAINGTALGGGYELCLGCHYRIALQNPKTLIGLPEVTIGLLPGGGGTQRLPRMLGLQTALPLLVEGKKVGVSEALSLGLIDAVADSTDQMLTQARAWIMAHPNPIKPWDEVNRKTGKVTGKDIMQIPGGNVQSPLGMQVFGAGTAMMMANTHGNYPAPLAIFSCVYEGLQVSIDQGLAIESQYFVQVATSKVAQNLIRTMFLGQNEANKGASRPKLEPPTTVKKVGIAGLDSERSTLIQLLTQAGMEATPIETDTDYDLIISIITPDTLPSLTNEDGRARLAPGGVLLFWATQVGSAALAVALGESGESVGLCVPDDLSKASVVELVRGARTDDHAVAVAFDLVRKMRKTPIVVNVGTGFYMQRVAATYADEGQRLLDDGVQPVLIKNAGRATGMTTSPVHQQSVSASPASSQPSIAEVKQRLLYRQVIETVRCRQEGIVGTQLDADLGSILGWGFPAYTGGTASFIAFVGAETFKQECNRLAKTYGDRFKLPDGVL